VTVCFADLDGIDEHCCLEVIFRFLELGGIDDHLLFRAGCLFYQQNKQSPVNGNGNQFNEDQQNKQSPPNSNGNQFHHNQQTE
jgi:hypothetical protein